MHWLREKIIILGIKLRRRFASVHTWGLHRWSFLIIPHSEKLVLKIRLSNYLLTFLLITSAVVTSLTLAPRVLTGKDLAAMEKLVESSNEREVFKMAVKLQIMATLQELDAMRQLARSLNEFVWGDIQSERYFRDLFDDLKTENIAVDGEDMARVLAELTTLRGKLEDLRRKFNGAGLLLSHRMRVHGQLPMGRPFRHGIGYTTSPFGPREDTLGFGGVSFHRGIDLATSENTPIYSTGPGLVIKAHTGIYNPFGKHAIIRHEFGYTTVYAHCSGLAVYAGQRIKKDQLIGWVGVTGKTTGPHLHYEVRVGGKAINPDIYLNPLQEDKTVKAQ